MHKYYYTYKITLLKGSLINNYYYGRHKTNKLDDGYAGSGRKLDAYYSKYGKIEGVTYKKDIVAFYDNDDELNRAEYELIGDKYDTDPLCLNLCVGGTWGELSEESCKKISKALTGKHPNEETRKKISKGGIGNQNAKGHKASEEKREKLRQQKLDRIWIHLNGKTKFVELEYLDYWLDDGWIYGRGPTFNNETKALMRQQKLDRVWIYLGTSSKLIEKSSLQYWLDKGWLYGRGKTKKSKQNND